MFRHPSFSPLVWSLLLVTSTTFSLTASGQNTAPELAFTGGSLTENWAQLGQDIDGESILDRAGRSVALSADGLTAIIGATGNDGNGTDSGHARIFRFDESSKNWTQLGQDIAGEVEGDNSGNSVALSTDGLTAIIGARSNDGNGTSSGHARIFRFDQNSESWTQLGQDIDSEDGGDLSGSSVALSADGLTAIIGARGNDGNGFSSGHARIFRFDESSESWTQFGQDIDGEDEGDQSGESVALSADGLTAIIGASNNDNNGNEINSGHARIFHFDESSGNWTQLGQDINGEDGGDSSGRSIALNADGRTAIIGATHNEGNGDSSGHARIFRFDESSENWIQLGQDINGETEDDGSGSSVALSADGRTAIIGATGNDGNGISSGHARIFHFDESSGNWTQLGQDIDGESREDFSGGSVDLSADGRTAIIGASGNDRNGDRSGHARIFRFQSVQNYSIIENTTGITDIMVSDDTDSEGSGITYSLSGTDATFFTINASGILNFDTPPNFETPVDADSNNLYELTVIATDSDSLSTQQALEITVVSNRPSLSEVLDFNLRRNQITSIIFTLADFDTKAEDLIISASSDNQSLIDNSTLLFSGTGTVRTIPITPASGQVGSATITVTLSDGVNTVTNTFVVTVVHDAPELAFTGGSLTQNWTQLGLDIDGEAEGDRSGDSVALSADGRTAIIGAIDNDGNGDRSGHARIFRFDESSGSWAQLGQDINGEAEGDQASNSVALSADGLTAIIGASRNDGNGFSSGHARIFHFDQSSESWIQLGQDIDGEAQEDNSGSSVALSSDGLTAIIGARSNDGNGFSSGHTRIFHFDESSESWTQLGQDINGETGSDQSGDSVALSADGLTAIIGAINNHGNGNRSGHARIFHFSQSSGSWAQLGQDINGEAAGDLSGSSVALSADGLTAIIGAINNDGNGTNSGHARIFHFNQSSGSWTQLGQDIDGESIADFSGNSVALSADGRTAIIGASRNDRNGSGSGHARIFHFDESSGNWIQLGQDIDGEDGGDQSGGSVALSADGLTAIIGASRNDRNGINSGHARIFRFQSVQNYSIIESTTIITDVMVSDDIDSEGSGITYSLSGADATFFTINASGILSFDTPPNFEAPGDADSNNLYELTVIATNSNSLSTQQALEITVVSNRPSHSEVFDFNLRRNQITSIIFTLADFDTKAEDLIISASSNNQNLIDDSTLLFSGTGAVRTIPITPATGQVGSATITVTLSDGVSTVTNTFVITVVNDAPKFAFTDGSLTQNWTQLGQDINGEAEGDNSGRSVALSADGLTAIIGARSNDGNGTSSGHARIFRFDQNSVSWIQFGQDIDSEDGGDLSGSSVALSSDGLTAIIGATGNDGNGTSSGHARIFRFDESSESWIQFGQDIDGEDEGDNSGSSVALSADGLTAIVGARGNDGNGFSSGHARIFRFDQSSGSWTQLGQDIDGEARSDSAGSSVALSADGLTAIVGARGNDGNGFSSGHARVFRFDQSSRSWTQLGQDIDGEDEGDNSGSSVALSADGLTAIIGASLNDGNGNRSGHARIFHFSQSSGGWTQLGQDIDGEAGGDNSGESVALSVDGRTAIIGASGNDRNGDRSGHARIFRFQSVQNYSIIENTTGITDIMVSDDTDSESSGITYSLSGSDASLFNINTNGILSFNIAPDFETPADADANNIYELTIIATDSDSDSSQQALEITITDVDEIAIGINLLQAPLVAGGRPLTTFYITATNHGPLDATNVVLSQSTTFPANTNLVSATPSTGSFANGNWTLDLASGGSASLTVVVQANADAISGPNALPFGFALTSHDQADSEPDNDSATTSAPIISVSDATLDTTPPSLDDQNNLLTATVTVTNNGGIAVPATRLFVTGLPDDVQISNVSGSTVRGPYLLLNTPLAPGASSTFTIEFTRESLDPNFTPIYEIEFLSETEIAPAALANIPITKTAVLTSGDRLLEIASIPGATYAVEYSSDLSTWQRVETEITASGNRLLWIDNGPPKTSDHPRDTLKRLYRFILISAPSD